MNKIASVVMTNAAAISMPAGMTHDGHGLRDGGNFEATGAAGEASGDPGETSSFARPSDRDGIDAGGVPPIDASVESTSSSADSVGVTASPAGVAAPKVPAGAIAEIG